MPEPRLRPVRVYLPDRDLMTTRVRGVGFRATYPDGSHGPTRKSYAAARADVREHKQAAQAGTEREAVTPAREREGC